MRNFFSLVRWSMLLLISFNIHACTSMPQYAPATPTFSPTITLTPPPIATVTLTATPTKTPIPTATPNLTATQQYEAFSSLVQEYYDAGQIPSTKGIYHRLDNFADELAMAYGYNWDFTGMSAKNFIIRADFDWEVANQKNFSGCGYVFRQVNNDHYHMIALDGLNGVVLFNVWPGADGFGNSSKVHTSINAVKKTKLPDLGSDPYHATFTVIMNDRHVYVYINDK